LVQPHQHIFHFDDVHGVTSKGVCACGEKREGRNYLIREEVDQLEARQGLVEMPIKRREQHMTAALPKAPPIPIELSPDAMTMHSLNLKIPAELSSGHQVSSLDICGEDVLLSAIALAFKAKKLSITVILS
jgi:hypothetical protein